MLLCPCFLCVCLKSQVCGCGHTEACVCVKSQVCGCGHTEVCVKSQECGCGHNEVYSHVCVISTLSDCGEVQ